MYYTYILCIIFISHTFQKFLRINFYKYLFLTNINNVCYTGAPLGTVFIEIPKKYCFKTQYIFVYNLEFLYPTGDMCYPLPLNTDRMFSL